MENAALLNLNLTFNQRQGMSAFLYTLQLLGLVL